MPLSLQKNRKFAKNKGESIVIEMPSRFENLSSFQLSDPESNRAVFLMDAIEQKEEMLKAGRQPLSEELADSCMEVKGRIWLLLLDESKLNHPVDQSLTIFPKSRVSGVEGGKIVTIEELYHGWILQLAPNEGVADEPTILPSLDTGGTMPTNQNTAL